MIWRAVLTSYYYSKTAWIKSFPDCGYRGCDGLPDFIEVKTWWYDQGMRLVWRKSIAELHKKGGDELSYRHAVDPGGNLHRRWYWWMRRGYWWYIRSFYPERHGTRQLHSMCQALWCLHGSSGKDRPIKVYRQICPGGWTESDICVPQKGPIWCPDHNPTFLARPVWRTAVLGFRAEPIWHLHHERDGWRKTVHDLLEPGRYQDITCETKGSRRSALPVNH